MPIFRVFKNGDGDFSYDNQVEGLVVAARNFNTYFTDGDPDKTFEDFIYGLINDLQCTVTYKRDNAAHCVTTKIVNKKKKFFYKKNGVETEIKIQGVQDNENDNKVKMCVPFRPVDPSAQYLTDALDKLEKTSIPKSKRAALLLGMLLLKRCR